MPFSYWAFISNQRKVRLSERARVLLVCLARSLPHSRIHPLFCWLTQTLSPIPSAIRLSYGINVEFYQALVLQFLCYSAWAVVRSSIGLECRRSLHLAYAGCSAVLVNALRSCGARAHVFVCLWLSSESGRVRYTDASAEFERLDSLSCVWLSLVFFAFRFGERGYLFLVRTYSRFSLKLLDFEAGTGR